jgi:hypothetical protein
MKEPSLLELSRDPQALQYRFLYLRTFHHPIAVRRIVNTDGTGTFISKELSGAGAYEPGHLIWNRRTQRRSTDVRDAFLDYLEKIDFWSLPTDDVPDDTVILDGAQWVLEAAKSGNYQVVQRWCADVDTGSPDDARFRRLCLRFLREASLKLSFDEVYPPPPAE